MAHNIRDSTETLRRHVPTENSANKLKRSSHETRHVRTVGIIDCRDQKKKSGTAEWRWIRMLDAGVKKKLRTANPSDKSIEHTQREKGRMVLRPKWISDDTIA